MAAVAAAEEVGARGEAEEEAAGAQGEEVGDREDHQERACHGHE